MSAAWGKFIFVLALPLALSWAVARAQEPPPDMPPPDGQVVFSDAQIDQMLAPVALYPDPLLAQMFMAATYPFEVARADRWMADNPGLTGDALAGALADQPWDPSVKSLVAVPQVLNWMATNSQWTEQLGEAFLAQGNQLMDHVQQLRQRAQQQGALASTPQQQVSDDGGYITIMPTDPQSVYVPVYQPDVVYGGWWWPGYPPYAFAAPVGAVFVGGFFWGRPVWVGPALWGRPDWRGRRVVVNQPNYNAFVRMPNGRPARPPGPDWQFDPNHRRGAPYRSPDLRSRYGGVDPRHPAAPPQQPAPGGRPGFGGPPQRPQPPPNVAPNRGIRNENPNEPGRGGGMRNENPNGTRRNEAMGNVNNPDRGQPAPVPQPPVRVAPQAPPRQMRPQQPSLPPAQPQAQPQRPAQPQGQPQRPQQPQVQPQAPQAPQRPAAPQGQPQGQPRPGGGQGGPPAGGPQRGGGERGGEQKGEPRRD